MKKLLSLFLAALLIVAALTPALAESPVEITVLFEGCNVTDDTAVLEQLNAYLAEKIGVTVKPVWGTWANFNDLASNAINAGSDDASRTRASSTKREVARRLLRVATSGTGLPGMVPSDPSEGGEGGMFLNTKDGVFHSGIAEVKSQHDKAMLTYSTICKQIITPRGVVSPCGGK